MKLTNKERWRYSQVWSEKKTIRAVQKRDEWIKLVRSLIPNQSMRYLELGCAPGLYTASLSEGTMWEIHGIDNSDDADRFLVALESIGKNGTLHKADLFSYKIEQKFDIVTSFGLVEHFRGASLDEVMEIHDFYTAEGGYVVIETPNFTGFQYIWHYIFDRPDLDNHNIDVMQPQSMQWFEQNGYEILFNDYIGQLRLWGNSGWLKYRLIAKAVAGLAVGLSKIARGMDALGIKLRGRSWSPDFLFVARKKRGRRSPTEEHESLTN